MKSFSFYSYEGSLTTPPCTERTTHIVVADPIPLSSTVIALFEEALKKPEEVEFDSLIENSEIIENNREIQSINDREIYVYDHWKFGADDVKSEKKKDDGHYEKRLIDVDDYIFINSEKPSAVPVVAAVAEQEIKKITEHKLNQNLKNNK